MLNEVDTPFRANQNKQISGADSFSFIESHITEIALPNETA